jgi:hypothetical protein
MREPIIAAAGCRRRDRAVGWVARWSHLAPAAARCSTSPRAAAATRAGSRRAGTPSSRSIAMLPRSRRCARFPAWTCAKPISKARRGRCRPARVCRMVVTHYLHRPLWPHLVDAVAPGGVLIYETFAQGNETVGKPSNPAFLLAPGELLDAVRGICGWSRTRTDSSPGRAPRSFSASARCASAHPRQRGREFHVTNCAANPLQSQRLPVHQSIAFHG